MCDIWVATGDVTQTGNVIVGKNSDRPIFDCQPLLFHAGASWPTDSKVQLEYVEIPQVARTCATLGSSPYWCWGYEEGINEHSVVVGNEALFTKTFRESAQAYKRGKGPEPGLLGMDLVRLALERSQTAIQAVEWIGRLVEMYGQFGSGVPGRDQAEGGYDNSFLIADPDVVWVVETVGKRWVAKRITAGYASISNEPSIRTEWDLGSSDIEQYAIRHGWWPEGRNRLDFARAYIDEHVPRQVSHIRVMRVRQLLAEREGEIATRWMMRIARDHYEDTFLDGPYFEAVDPDFHSVCMHVSSAGFTWGNTASSCIAVLPKCESELPVFWWTPGPPCNGCYVPFFVHGSGVPRIVSRAGAFGKRVTPPFEAAEDTFSRGSYWWLFRQLMDRTKGDPITTLPGYYTSRNPIVRRRFDALEREFQTQLPDVLKRAVASSCVDRQASALVLDGFTRDCVHRVVGTLNSLLEEFR